MNNTTVTQAYNPIEPVFSLIIIKFFCCFIGIPLNASIAVVIIRHRQLRSKPRKIFLLGIIFSNLSFFVPALIKLIYWAFYPVESLCKAYVALVGLPQCLLLLNMLLALVDRYFAIKDPLAHRNSMSVYLACFVVFTSSFFVVFLLKFVYLAGLVAVGCDVQPIHNEILTTILITLFLSCFTMNCIVFRQTKIVLRRNSRTLSPRNERIQLNETGNERGPDLNAHSTPMSIHADIRKTLQLEIEATHTLIMGVTSLFVTVFPLFVLLTTYFFCQLFYNGDDAEFLCIQIIWLMTYFKELGTIHATYNPLIFLMRNKELKVAMFG